MSDIKIWFTVGDNGDHMVAMHSGVIDDDFDPKSLLFENENFQDDGEWVTTYTPEVPSYVHDRIARLCNDETLIPALKEAYFQGTMNAISLTNGQGVCIKGVFDMTDVNEYGVARDLWDDVIGYES